MLSMRALSWLALFWLCILGIRMHFYILDIGQVEVSNYLPVFWVFLEGGFVPYRMPFILEDKRVCVARRSLLLVEIFSTVHGSAKFNQTFFYIFLFDYFQDQKYWPLMPPLPSYGYGREHPGPRYGSLIHGQNLRDIVITGWHFSLYR